MEILENLFRQFGLTEEFESITGAKYTAVLLPRGGRIGVCANLGRKPVNRPPEKLSIQREGDRIVIAAYFNALFNYREWEKSEAELRPGSGDLVSLVDFERYRRIVMVGRFLPIARQLDQKGIPYRVFDRDHSGEEGVEPEEAKSAALAGADAVIMTATALSNGTFTPLMESLSPVCAVYLLGPSALFHPALLTDPRVSGIFGARFQPGDRRVLDAIAAGQGTRSFLRFGEKAAYLRGTD